MTHTIKEIHDAVRELDLWGKLRDDQYCMFHVGDRVIVDGRESGTILGGQLSGCHYAILLDNGDKLRASHSSSLQRI